jgi:hypothetical protein
VISAKYGESIQDGGPELNFLMEVLRVLNKPILN